MKSPLLLIVTVAVGGPLALTPTAAGQAAAGGKAVREAVELMGRKFAKESVEHGAESLTRRLATLAARHGDDALNAARKCGPRGLKLVEEAGEHAPAAARLMARHGEPALAAAARPAALKLVGRYGDDAAAAVVKHAGVAESVIGAHGGTGAKALASLSVQEGRRLGMMHAAGELAKIGRIDDVLTVVARFGDAGLNFLWANKGKLAAAAALAAFLADPEPFLTGAKDLAQVAADAAVKPLAESAGRAVEQAAADLAPEIGRNTDWTAVISAAVAAVAAIVGLRVWLAYPRRSSPNPTTGGTRE